MELLTYAAVLNNQVVDLHVFENNISNESLAAIAEPNGFDYYIIKTEKTEIGSFIHEGQWVLAKPYESWTLDQDLNWVAPVAIPQEGGPHYWDENTLSWNQYTV